MNKRYILIFGILINLILINFVCADIASTNEYYQHRDVLLICNAASNDSMAICDYFASKRPTLTHIMNLTGISDSEFANSATYASILNQTSYYLNNTQDRINYIVTTKGVPLYTNAYIDYFYGGYYSVDSLLGANLKNFSVCRDISTYMGREETFSYSKFGFYIITRLTGYNVQDVKNLIDRSSLSNRDANALINGKFVLDESPVYFPNYLASTKAHLENDLGYSVIYGNTSSSPYFIRNATNVIGYYSWGSNDASYWTNSNVLNNSGFESWNGNNPGNWTNVSGSVYRGSKYSTADILEINNTGLIEIYQNFSSNNVKTRKYVYNIDYGYVNFIGNVSIGISSYDSSDNLVGNFSKVLVSSSSLVNLSSIGNNFALKYFPNISAQKIKVILTSNLVNGSFYISSIQLNEIAPSNNWTNGSIGITAVSTSARSFLNTTSYGQSLIADLIHDGISGIEGFVSEPEFGAVALPYILFDRYSKGYNLGDSFYMASDNLGWKDVIVGDPKTVIRVPGLSSSISMTDLLDNERINNGSLINFTLGSNFNISNMSYYYNNGSDFGPFNLSITNNFASINTSNWSYGNYNVTVFLTDILGNTDNKTFRVRINQTVGNRPNYNTFDGMTTNFKDVFNRTSTNVILEKTGYGKIDYRDSLLNVSGYDFDNNVIFSKNNITIFVENASSLNRSAELSFYTLGYNKNPLIYRNGILCSSTGIINCSINSYNSSTGELNINVSGFSSYSTGVNANLSVFDDSDSEEVKINQVVKFYANYTMNNNQTPITDGNCTILFSNGSFVNATYNSSSKLYEYSNSFSIGGVATFTFNCTNNIYENLSTSDSFSISSCLRPLIDQDWNISSEQTCENLSFTMPQNRSINILSGGNLTLINTTVIMNLSLNGSAGLNISGTGMFNVVDSNITSLSNRYYFIVNGSYFSINGSKISYAGWNSTRDCRGLEIYSSIDLFSNITLLNNYATLINSSNNILANLTTLNNYYGIWFEGGNNTLIDSILSNDVYNIKSMNSSNVLLNASNSSTFDGNITRRWYFNLRVLTGLAGLSGASVSLNGVVDYSWTTDSSGYIGRSNLDEDIYSITVQKSGYYSASQSSYELNQNILNKTISLTVIPGSNNVGDSGGGGGGGGGGATLVLKNTTSNLSNSTWNLENVSTIDLCDGYKLSLSENEKVRFILENISHFVEIVKIDKDSVFIRLFSITQEARIKLKEEKSFDLDGDGDYDIFIKLISITNNGASLQLNISPALLDPKENKLNNIYFNLLSILKKYIYLMVLIFLISLLLIVYLIVCFKQRNYGKRKYCLSR